MFRHSYWLVFLAATLAAAKPSRADLIDYAAGGYFTGPDEAGQVTGPNQVSFSASNATYDTNDPPNYLGTTSASGSIQATSENFMRVRTGVDMATSYAAQSYDYTSYRDKISYSGPDEPKSLTLTFGFSGIVGLSEEFLDSPAFAYAAFRIVGQNGFGFLGANGTYGPGFGVALELNMFEKGLHVDLSDTLQLDEASLTGMTLTFQGRYSMKALRTVLGTYEYGIVGVAQDQIFGIPGGGSAFTDASHTITLQGISSPDGTPIDPGRLSFESGFRFKPAAVPEPSTIVTLGTGALCLLGYAWRRRRDGVSLSTEQKRTLRANFLSY